MKHKWMMEVTLAEGEYSSITKRFTEIFTDAINKFGYFGEAVDTGGAQLRGALEALKEERTIECFPVEALMDPKERRRLESARYLGFKTVAEFDEWEASHEDAAPKRLTETSSSDDPFAGPGPYGVSDAGNGQNILLWKVNTEKKYAVIKISAFGPDAGPYDGVAELVDVWKKTADAAREHDVSRLLWDVVGNGGGDVTMAYAFVRVLFPDLEAREICQLYDERNSPLAQEFLKILTKENYEKLEERANDPAFLAELFNSSEILGENFAWTQTVLQAVERAFPGWANASKFIPSLQTELVAGKISIPDAVERLVQFFDNLPPGFGSDAFMVSGLLHIQDSSTMARLQGMQWEETHGGSTKHICRQ